MENTRQEGVRKEDEDLVDPTFISNPEDAGETRFYRRSKLTKRGDRFIGWSPPREEQSPDPPISSGDRFTSVATGEFMEDVAWLEDDSWTEDRTPHRTSVSTPLVRIYPDVFEDPLDPALFCSEDSTSQPSSPGSLRTSIRLRAMGK